MSGQRPTPARQVPDPWCPRCGDYRLDHEPPGSRCRPWLVALFIETGPDIAAILLSSVMLRVLVGYVGPVTWPSDITLVHASVVVLVLVFLVDLAYEIVEQVSRLGRAIVHGLVRLVRWCMTRVRTHARARRNVQP